MAAPFFRPLKKIGRIFPERKFPARAFLSGFFLYNENRVRLFFSTCFLCLCNKKASLHTAGRQCCSERAALYGPAKTRLSSPFAVRSGGCNFTESAFFSRSLYISLKIAVQSFCPAAGWVLPCHRWDRHWQPFPAGGSANCGKEDRWQWNLQNA